MPETYYQPPSGPPPSTQQGEAEDDESAQREGKLAQLISDIKDYQITHGNLLKLVRFEESTRVPAVGSNISCAPTPFPRRHFDEAMALQETMNELYIRCASDPDWLYGVLRPQIESDPDGMVASLWNIYFKSRELAPVQNISCAIFRSDYMVHGDGEVVTALKQVEMNTFSVAGACHSERVAGMHRYLRRRTLAETVRIKVPS